MRKTNHLQPHGLGTKAWLLPWDMPVPHRAVATSAWSSGMQLKCLCQGSPWFWTLDCCK